MIEILINNQTNGAKGYTFSDISNLNQSGEWEFFIENIKWEYYDSGSGSSSCGYNLYLDNFYYDEDIFGPGGIDIRPTGTAEISFGFNTNRTDNPQIPQKQRRITTFDFNERIQINLLGTVGDKLKINFSHNANT